MTNSFRLTVAICALLMALTLACSSATNDNASSTNKASANGNSSTANTAGQPIVERENAISITSDGSKYLDRAVLPDNTGSPRTKPFTSGDRLRISLSPRFDNLGGISGFLAELSASGSGTPYKANGNVPVSSSTNVDIEFSPPPPVGGYKLTVWAIQRGGSEPIQIATGKVFIDPQ
jgi:hypothetical protein